MSSIPVTVGRDEPASAAPTRHSNQAWWASTRVWGGASIVAMWVAVLFDGVFGPDFVSASTTSHTTVPSVVFVAVCAMVGTIAVTHAALRGGDTSR